MASIPNAGVYPLVYTIGSGTSYLNVYQNFDRWAFRGAYVGVPNSGSLYTVKLSTAQLQSLGNAIRMHLSTGVVNQTINGVQVVSNGASLNVVVAAVSFTITLAPNDAANLATALLQYVVTGAPPQPASGGPSNFFDPNL